MVSVLKRIILLFNTLNNVRVAFVKYICNMYDLYGEHQKTHFTGVPLSVSLINL